jgi:fructuronate reductase
MNSTPSVRSLPSALKNKVPDLSLPKYDLNDVKIGVVHIGCGQFHRAHQALYFDDLLNSGDLSWGISAVSWNSGVVRDNLKHQDNLYTVHTNNLSKKPRVVGAIREILVAPENPEAVLARMASPDTKLITLTIGQKGYYCNMSDNTLLLDKPEVRNDFANPTQPQTAMGYLVEAFARRKLAGLPGVTVLPCDNIPGNGVLTEKVVRELAQARDPALAAWIDSNVTFPNTVVDRITPEFRETHRQFLIENHRIDSRAPIFTEDFQQWVIEDKFVPGTKPPLDQFGARFVEDAKPYELLKLRLLNGTHMAIAYTGMMAGHAKVAELMANPGFASFVIKFLDEVAETIPAIPGFNIASYKRSVFERLTSMDDDVERLGRDGSVKLQGRILPSLKDALDQGTPIEAMAYAVAGWMRYVAGHSDSGQDHLVKDPNADRLRGIARAYRQNPAGLLGEQAIFGHDLPQNNHFNKTVGRILGDIYEKGMYQVMAAIDDGNKVINPISQFPIPPRREPQPQVLYG